MRYNTLDSHDNVYEVPAMMTYDKPIYLGITNMGNHWQHGESRSQWAFTFATGPYDADVQLQGDDLHGPAIGPAPEPGEMAASVMGFYSAYAEGELVTEGHNGESETYLYYDDNTIAVGETAEFIVANGERFGIASSDLEEGYIAYTDNYFNDYLRLYVKQAFPTGKEVE